MSEFSAIVLAAGKGTRMNTALPKVCHPVAGRPMVERVVKAVKAARAKETRVVVGFGETMVRAVVEPLGAICFKQADPRGTADAVRAADVESLSGDVVILNGDHPLIEPEDILNFHREFRDARVSVAVVTCELPNPGALGRIVRQKDQLKAIVEAKDASADTLKIHEINTGIYVVQAAVLQQLLPRIQASNAQREFYLTDLIALAVESNLAVAGIKADPRVATGVNSQAELALATSVAFERKARRLMEGGVMMEHPPSVFIEDAVEISAGTLLQANVHLRGTTRIGKACVIETGTVIKDSTLGDHVLVKAGCYLDQAKVGTDVDLGPFAHLRPGTEIGDRAHVGNFVEMKKTKFGAGAKAGHLTYLGDAEVGENTNVGCGTITCNYAVDRQKYRTKIGADVFVGSDVQFVAPVTIGDGAVIGSGTTVTKDVPAKALAVGRPELLIKTDYVPRARGKK